MRTYTHIIDTKAIKITLNSIPDHWVVRELTERDYGIDLMIEIFRESDRVDKNKRAVYEATGHVCYLQIKGTNEEILINDDETVSYQVEKKFLLNAEKYSTPMLLVYVSTINPIKNHQVYFVWVQRYIIDVLEAAVPDWRSKQESYSFKIPIRNSLPLNAEKIEHRIAPRIKYLEEHSEFYEKYTLYREAFPAMVTGH
ncbi:MAG TPA: DUF4365 domain-containing protein [Cyclobacteriaceae bacterium]|nr:DUF4365 domain-containing protein [Cyclobacteriaceae bacterium]